MADPVVGALVRLIPKLYQLLSKEYNLPTRTKERIRSITLELEGAQAALRKVSQVPWDHLDEQVQIWAREVRESSYDMEDVLDAFLVRVPDSRSTEKESKQPLKFATNIWKKMKARHKIGEDVKNIMKHLEEATERCRRYKVHDITVIKPATSTVEDRRLHAMYKKPKNVVGIDESKEELISKLQSQQTNHALSSNVSMKIVSVVGVAGLGKTTLAKAVYDKLKVQGRYDYWAFVPVGRLPDLTKVFKDILIDFDKQRYLQFSNAGLDKRQLIDELRSFLKNKRYFIVIDDIWEIQDWETIKLALDCDNNSSGTIIITTRNLEVATIAGDVYKLQPLPYDESRELFFRIFGHEGKFGGHWSDDITDKFIWKCDGIPLAIIAMASLLVRKQREEWHELYKTFDFCRRGPRGNMEAEYAMMILSSSYKDLPSHLRICLLYLSGFPEDYVIPKDSLVWKWVAEGFIIGNQESRLFEIGEGYFNDLVNRSLIEAVESDYHDNIVTGCRVPIMVLHFIRFMSRQENFFTLVDDNQDTLLHSNVRRLANHNRTIGHTNQTKHIEMPKVRSFAALGCLIETWAPHSSFTLLRVVAIENCNPMDGCHRVRVEHLGHLLHLRFLSLRGTRTEKIPEKIGALRFLQMLDLWESNILELPSNNSLPRQMLCLRITFHDAFDAEVPSLETLKSLEELKITGGPYPKAARRWLEDLGSLTELRVLHASGILFDDEETERTFGESLRQLHKLEHLTIIGYDSDYQPRWQATEFVLSRHLQHLAVYNVLFCKLPSCINPSCLGNLSHLNLKVEYMDEYDLKILGLLPELGFLELELWSSITITNFSDSDTVYFSKLRCCRLTRSMVFFCENEADRTVSFHIDIDDLESGHGDECESDSSSDDEWESDSGDEFPGPMASISDDELQRPGPSMYDDGLYGDDKLQIPAAPVSDEELNIPPFQHSTFQYGLAALAYYLLAFFQYVLAFVKKWSSKQVVEQPLISSLGSCHGNGEDPIAIAMTSTISSDEDKGSICGDSTEAPRFMPTLQVLGFQVSVRTMPMREDHHYCDNLGLEYFASLRKVEVCILPLPRDTWGYERDLEAALRRAVQVHPNRPTLHFL